MSVLMVRARVKAESAADAEASTRRMFAAVADAHPDGVRYASLRLPDGVTYVALLELEDGTDNPLPKVPEWVEFQHDLEQWRDEQPAGDRLEVIGSYRLF